MDRRNLYSFIPIVPSGMGEIAIREAEGWAYIHPTFSARFSARDSAGRKPKD